MLQIAALLSSGGSDDSREEALSLAGRLVFEALPVDDGPVAVKGLVVSEIFKYLTEIQTAQALVQIWAEGTDDEAVVLDHVLPVKERGDVSVDAWVVRELVFRQPLERESIGASPNGVKLAGTAYKRDDFTLEAFFDYWENIHAHISGKVPGLGGYVVSRISSQLAGDLCPDALLELWYPDEATLEASGSAPEQVAAWEDVPRYAKTTGTFWLMHETVIVPPPSTGPGPLLVADA
jgi:uncharacterized protein (TIGR02118 family)